MFITTANVVENLPAPLRDRMEIIPFSCYTLNEKKQIGLDYLAPRQLRTLGYSQSEISFTPEAMSTLISGYTRDAGLRSVNREIGNVCRKINLHILQQAKQPPISISSDDIVSLLGYERYTFEAATAQPLIGVTAGLVWSEYGGQLIYIETAKMKGTGQLLMTGSLGDILKESAQTALSFIRSNATQFSIDENMFEQTDIHVHIPAGDISKDGASAGITIAMALLSLLTKRPARRDVALTGEFTLSGRVLPVGGLREKILAAQQAGVRTILLPERNKREVLVMNDEVRNAAELHFISSINEVVDLVLLPPSQLQHAQGED
jgi:ATP-dependent Lon protease